jgi:hypothetical protein
VDDLKTSNKEAYLASLYDRRQVILERIQDRLKQREEITKRGSKGAQRRMQMLAELGGDENGEKKRQTRSGGVVEKEREDGNDDFGITDEDWDVYREIQKDGFSEDEEEDQNNLAELED